MRAILIRVMTGIGGVCLTHPGFTQTLLYEEITASHLPAMLAGACMDAASGDADGDGDIDLALAMEFATNILLLNDGTGSFSDHSAQLPRTSHDSEDVAFADFDGDGDLDLVLVSEDDRKDELYINDGNGNFTDASARLLTDDISNALVVMDLDGDAIPDLLTGNIGIDRVLISDGRGGFRDETEARWPQDGLSRTQDLELADVDGDGDLDVLAANEGQNQLFLNEDGILVDATARNLPARNDETREIRAADVDGDNDLDLLIANVQFIMQESAQDYLLLNDGSGVFTAAQPGRFPEDARSNFTVQAVDIDRDGDMDVIAPSTVFARSEAEFLVVYNTPDKVMQIARARELNMQDVDGDGRVDATLSADNRSHTFMNDGNGLVASLTEPAWTDIHVPDGIDIDSDGRADMSFTTLPLAMSASGDGQAPDGEQIHGTYAEVQLIDLNQNGSLDIIVPLTRTMDAIGNYRVLLNDGTGHFDVAPENTLLPPGMDGNGFDIEVADFDADGLLDIFFCNRASIGAAAADSGGLQRLLRAMPADD